MNAPGKYYDVETADWKNCKADVLMVAVISASVYRNMGSQEQQLAANCCGSDVPQRHFLSVFHIFLSLCTVKNNSLVNDGRYLSLRYGCTGETCLPPAGHGPTLFTQLLMDNRPKLWLWLDAWSKWERWQRPPFKWQQATCTAASHISWLNTWAGLQWCGIRVNRKMVRTGQNRTVIYLRL